MSASTEVPDPAGLRAALVETLRSKRSLGSPAIAEAFAAVPRHLFVPDVSVEDAYRGSLDRDEALGRW